MVKNALWVAVALVGLLASSQADLGAGLVLAYGACLLARWAAKTKGANNRGESRRPSSKSKEQADACPPAPCLPQMGVFLNDGSGRRVRKYVRRGSDLVVWVEPAPENSGAKSGWFGYIWGLCSPRKPRPAGPKRARLVIPWGKERKVWKLKPLLVK